MMFATGTLEDSYFYWSMIRAEASLRWFRDNVVMPGRLHLSTPKWMRLPGVSSASRGYFFYPYLQERDPICPVRAELSAGLYDPVTRLPCGDDT